MAIETTSPDFGWCRPSRTQPRKVPFCVKQASQLTSRWLELLKRLRSPRCDLEYTIGQLRQQNVELERRIADRTARLQKTLTELETLFYCITHDLRAPLRAMQSFAQLLIADYSEGLGADGREFARRIATSADRMDKLIQDVLTYNRALTTELKMEPVDVLQVLRELMETYPEFQMPRAEISIEGAFPTVNGNQAALTQCVSNLLSNAVKFVAAGVRPKIRIRAETHGRSVRLWFEDNGIGIEEEFQEKIFGIFQRLNKSYDGTGMGLPVARKAAERMNGKVGFESQPGTGSRFWIELQLATQEPLYDDEANPVR
jgi:signal transduction histidine kinase